MDFTMILNKLSNDELKKMWYTMTSFEFMADCEPFDNAVLDCFENEIKKRITNGSMSKPNLAVSASDWNLFVHNCF